jgi:hypothetical protein
MVRIQELTNLQDYFWSLSEDSTQLSTPDRASPALLLLNWNLYKWRTTSIVWCVEFRRQGVFIGVPGAITDLIKSVICQVLADRPSHMAGRPSSAATTDSRPRVPFHCLLESVTTKETHGRLQSGVGRPPTGPTH